LVLWRQWEWNKEVTTTQELKNELLLDTVELESTYYSPGKYSIK
jgi:uncharacterized protein YecE (DUF72 family)